jgi:hypothetical protein
MRGVLYVRGRPRRDHCDRGWCICQNSDLAERAEKEEDAGSFEASTEMPRHLHDDGKRLGRIDTWGRIPTSCARHIRLERREEKRYEPRTKDYLSQIHY